MAGRSEVALDTSTGGDPSTAAPTVIPLVVDEPSEPLVQRFETVYRASYDRMTQVAFLLTGSNEVAEEVVQDAFIAFYQRVDDVAEPAGHLYRSVVDGCRAHHRRRALVERLHIARPSAPVVPSELDETWQALAAVTPRRRAALVLRYHADLPLVEIACALGCSTGTVRSLIHRGLAQLEEVLEP
jgi:RNA polymerase sigma factor (sigma-70 family)